MQQLSQLLSTSDLETALVEKVWHISNLQGEENLLTRTWAHGHVCQMKHKSVNIQEMLKFRHIIWRLRENSMLPLYRL